MKAGTRSKTGVCLCYIEDILDPDLLNIVKKEIEAIDADSITAADQGLVEYITGQGYNPFPFVRYTERPDVAAVHILEGYLVIIVDTSPSVIITPTTLFNHVQHPEEYRQPPGVGTLLRWMRFFGILISFLIVPFWLLLVEHQNLVPPVLDFIGLEEELEDFPVFVQIPHC
ncbi:spore germination protein [Salicibibacter cibarius]|uniref:spore germination protein n=1 Tax=Salicibibacter cibarius TaxID=2743000 RepID=UPI002484422D|nr:spore germination protein [Salicibibacter cibarius]